MTQHGSIYTMSTRKLEAVIESNTYFVFIKDQFDQKRQQLEVGAL
jgi:hypothetical protein